MKIVYVVGRFHGTLEEHTAWEIMGIFEDKAEAVRHCITKNDFVGPFEVGTYVSETRPWPGCWYPIEGD